jgi:hypothetical protein
LKEFIIIVILLLAIFGIANVLALIPLIDNFPQWLYVTDILERIVETEFELGKALFGAQIALSAVFVTFLGLLIQFFENKKKYLGIDIRHIIFSQKMLGLKISSLAIVSFLIIVLSYYYLATNQLNQIISIFIINLIILIYLLIVYSNIVTGKVEIEENVIKLIESNVLEEIKKENKVIINKSKGN